METHSTVVDQPAPAVEQEPVLSKDELAHKIIRQNVVWAAGGGVLPFPIVDIIAITAINVKMLREIAGVYGLHFREDQVKGFLASLLAGLGAPVVGMALTVSLVKSVPFVGALSAIAAVPAFAAAFTYAVGQVFLQHFAAGGTFLDFDPKKVREHFAHEFAAGKTEAQVRREEAAQV